MTHAMPPRPSVGATLAATVRQRFAIAAVVVAIALATATAISPPSAQSDDDFDLAAYVTEHAQGLTVPSTAAAASIARGDYSATPGYASLAAEGTNYSWAKMVLLAGNWPQSDANVTVMLRWMRQENGSNNWWNRNNPMNNGWGSGGGGGTGTYANLIIAAQKAAEALGANPGYGQIVANLAASSPTEVTEAAIWASPWATSHYANGAHWHYTPVDVVSAPAGAWG